MVMFYKACTILYVIGSALISYQVGKVHRVAPFSGKDYIDAWLLVLFWPAFAIFLFLIVLPIQYVQSLNYNQNAKNK